MDTSNLPHSRACGIRKHEHGGDCHSNCPTCGGRSMSTEQVESYTGTVELTVKPSALEELAQAVLDGRVSLVQHPASRGSSIVRTEIRVAPAHPPVRGMD